MAGEMKHERIWLEPSEIGDEHPDGRLWCQDNVWGDEADEYVLASSVDSIQSEIAALRAALQKIADTTDRCEHDGGFDREIGPIGCLLGDKCVCIGLHPIARAALQTGGPGNV